ncbi:uncharacterized protein BJX67DRAFT_41652 [Aspergillus lucknowensis]|uniref:Ilp is an apoptosis inhibitor n=1 Tax=Aspergillus lucknowensis TaxID=176173 RepID=A0ABR4LVB1_9EURO
MSLNDSHHGRGLGSAIRSLFRSSSRSPPRRRVSQLLRRNRTVLSRPPRDQTDRPLSSPRTTSNPDPAAMLGLSEVSQNVKGDGFDIFEWYPHYQNCQRYFLDNAQHSRPVQALSAYLNIRLPFQQQPHPVPNSSAGTSGEDGDGTAPGPSTTSSIASFVSLVPYIRRLVATGMDYPGVLHGFFGDDWQSGVGRLHEQERCNYLFAAKSGGWASVKKDYDNPPLETIPFLRPLQGPLDTEIEAAERSWSEWLAMEDWMVGPRAPDALQDTASQSSQPRNTRG